MLWMTNHITRRTCSKNVWSHLFKQMFDSAGSTWWSWHFKKVVSWNFD